MVESAAAAEAHTNGVDPPPSANGAASPKAAAGVNRSRNCALILTRLCERFGASGGDRPLERRLLAVCPSLADYMHLNGSGGGGANGEAAAATDAADDEQTTFLVNLEVIRLLYECYYGRDAVVDRAATSTIHEDDGGGATSEQVTSGPLGANIATVIIYRQLLTVNNCQRFTKISDSLTKKDNKR